MAGISAVVLTVAFEDAFTRVTDCRDHVGAFRWMAAWALEARLPDPSQALKPPSPKFLFFSRPDGSRAFSRFVNVIASFPVRFSFFLLLPCLLLFPPLGSGPARLVRFVFAAWRFRLVRFVFRPPRFVRVSKGVVRLA